MPYAGFMGDYQAIQVLTPVVVATNPTVTLPTLAKVVNGGLVLQAAGEHVHDAR